MRRPADATRVTAFAEALGRRSPVATAYLVGGATAVLVGPLEGPPRRGSRRRAMIERRLVDPRRAWGLYRAIAPELPRFPAIDQRSFRDRVERAFGPEA